MYRLYRKWGKLLILIVWAFTWLTIFVRKERLLTDRVQLFDIPVSIRPLTKAATVPPTPKPILKEHYLLASSLQGRLGNQMFRIASLIGMAHTHRYTPVASRQIVSSVSNAFNIKLPVLKPTKSFQKFNEKSAGIFDSRILNISHQFNWTLTGYFQSWKYFANASDIIRKHFLFKPSILKQANASLPQRDKPLIGVHVRRGDMNSKRERARGYNVADLEYINRAMNYFRDKFGSVRFVVVSDDLTWCKKKLTSPDTIIVRVSREVDLAILSLCDHNIVTSGSFGWWGAWLAGGQTVYFKNFPAKDSWLAKQYKYSDYYPPHWVGML